MDDVLNRRWVARTIFLGIALLVIFLMVAQRLPTIEEAFGIGLLAAIGAFLKLIDDVT